MAIHKFEEGAMWEDYGWEIHTDVQVEEFLLNKPCKHCYNQKTISLALTGTTGGEKKQWTCPRVVIAFNEGGCCSTGVCLDCIIEKSKETFGGS